MKFHRNTIWLFPLLIILSFPLWSIPVGEFLTPRGNFDPLPKNEQGESHDFNMQTVKILQNQQGQKTALIRAAKAHTGEDPNILMMELVNGDIFDADGYITKVIANKGQYSMISKILTLTGDVVVNKTRDKQFLYTDKLFYDSEKRTVLCPGKTSLTGEKVTIEGGSLEYNINSSSYLIDNRVQCTIHGFLKP